MNTRISVGNRLQEHHRRLLTAGAALLLVLPWGARAGGVVTTCTEAALRAAMAGGGTVTFACDGTITLGRTITNVVDTLLDGSGHDVAISGGGSVQVFWVSTNVSFTIHNLAIVNGLSTNGGGGGVFNAGGTLNATNCAFVGNSASGPPVFAGSPSFGGAIYNAGALHASGCSFLQNSVTGGTGVYGFGGGTWSSPGPGGSGGPGSGGAIYNAGTMAVERSLFANNTVAGGTGGHGGDGVWIYMWTGIPQTGGHGGNGGDGNGGALFNGGTAALVNCTFAGNSGMGGAGGRGGNGGAIIESGRMTSFPGGDGGNGGSGFGALCDATGLLCLTNCTVAVNTAVASSGGAGGSSGGGMGGSSGTNGGAWGGVKSSGSAFINTLLAANSPGGNTFGAVADLGHNLSSDNTCSFTNTGSLNNTDPKIGPLANNGGPTLTMALLPGSPAIDAADPAAAPATDQRGIRRPLGPTPDIGAFEYGLPAVLRISGSQETGLDLIVSAYPGLSCRLLVNSGLSNWLPIATNQIGTNGTALFHDNCMPGAACLFYRAVVP